MQNRKIIIGPIALTAVLTTNILNCAVTSMAGPVGIVIAQPYVLINHFRIINRTGAAVTFSLWLGATGANAAGTEVMGQGTSVPANSFVDYYPGAMRLDSTAFLVGGASSANALTLLATGEVGISG